MNQASHQPARGQPQRRLRSSARDACRAHRLLSPPAPVRRTRLLVASFRSRRPRHTRTRQQRSLAAPHAANIPDAQPVGLCAAARGSRRLPPARPRPPAKPQLHPDDRRPQHTSAAPSAASPASSTASTSPPTRRQPCSSHPGGGDHRGQPLPRGEAPPRTPARPRARRHQLRLGQAGHPPAGPPHRRHLRARQRGRPAAPPGRRRRQAPALDPRSQPRRPTSPTCKTTSSTSSTPPAARRRQLTSGARGTGKTHGLAEYIAQEEMDRDHGFWWSWDGRLLAFTEVDETHIPAYRIVHQGKDRSPARAPRRTTPTPSPARQRPVRLGVVAAAGSDKVTWMDLGDDPEQYLARVQWLPRATCSPSCKIASRASSPSSASTPQRPPSGAAPRDLRRLDQPPPRPSRLESTEGDAAGGFVWAASATGFTTSTSTTATAGSSAS
jgi:hypothetical protein